MLDYDAMRSKVKKLVEKPDKDPAKLPRTEKEMEMVSIYNLFLEPDEMEPEMEPDLAVPSPPKVLDGIAAKRAQLLVEDDEFASRYSASGSGVRRTQSLMTRVSSFRRSMFGADPDEALLQRSASRASTRKSPRAPSTLFRMPSLRESSTDALLQRSSTTSSRHVKSPRPGTPMPVTPQRSPRAKEMLGSPLRPNEDITESSRAPSRSPRAKEMQGSPLRPDEDAAGSSRAPSRFSPLRHTPSYISKAAKAISDRRKSWLSTSGSRPSTPFWHPSELEEIMQPLKEEYLKSQTDKLAQAKAAYEQLNEQLTAELPQLIDLRYTFLSPLRLSVCCFADRCAEYRT
jgi:hypothetical protein